MMKVKLRDGTYMNCRCGCTHSWIADRHMYDDWCKHMMINKLHESMNKMFIHDKCPECKSFVWYIEDLTPEELETLDRID